MPDTMTFSEFTTLINAHGVSSINLFFSCGYWSLTYWLGPHRFSTAPAPSIADTLATFLQDLTKRKP